MLVLAPAHASDFMTEVRPIFESFCVECHAYGNAQGSFSIESRASMLEHDSAVSVGNASRSRLIALVRGDDPNLSMPFDGEKLTDAEVVVLSQWIDQGAQWPPGFRFRSERASSHSVRPRRPAVPPAVGELVHPVDRILDRYASNSGVELSPVVSDEVFLRRASLDLIGLLPSRAEIEGFVPSPEQSSGGENKREALVRSLLDDRPAYAAHWLSFWNDLLRNDYSGTGYIDGGRKQITGWLYRALLDNKPYDQFVSELVDPTDATAGFAAGIAWRGEASASQAPEIQYARVVSQVFLGTNVKCASCHDSFINRWKLADTYALAAVIADRPLELHRCDKPTGELAKAGFLFPEIGDVDADAPRSERLRQFAKLMTSPENGRLSRTIVNRLWQRLMGRGLVEPVDDMEQPPWSRDLLDFLAADLADRGYDLKRTLELITTSRAYQRQSVPVDPQAPAEQFTFRGPTPKRMTAEQFVDALWRVAGIRPEAPAKSFAEITDVEPTVRAALVSSDGLQLSLGRPNREQVVSTRPSELVTLQALDLTNGDQVVSLVQSAALRLSKQGTASDQLIERLFLELLTRRPSESEQSIAKELLDTSTAQEGIEDLVWILLMHPDFQLIG